jgi:hypothetical protein
VISLTTMSNQIMITLRADQRSRLMASVHTSSEIWNALDNGTRFSWRYGLIEEVTYSVVCEEMDARLLLFCSRKNCPDAAEEIVNALCVSGRVLH